VKDKIINIFKGIVNDKKKLLLILGIVLCVIIIVLIGSMFFNKDELIGVTRNPDGEKIKEEYINLNGTKDDKGKLYPEVNIPSNNILKYISVNEILRMFEEDGDTVIFIGSSKNLYSRSVIEVLCDSAISSELDVIYYLDIEKEMEGYDELVKLLGDRFVVKENGKKKLYVPSVIFVVDGSIVSHNKGTLFSHEDPYIELDKDQKEGLSEIYKYGIRDVIDAKKYN